jgi:hypothetical protein
MKALYQSESPTSLQSLLPPTRTESELLRQNKLLRDHVKRLVSTNVDLLRQIENLSRELAQPSAHALAGEVTRSIRNANAARVAQAGEGQRFTVSEMEARHLGSIHISMAGIPPPVLALLPTLSMPSMTSVPPAQDAPPLPDVRLRSSLQHVQTVFSVRRGAGKAAYDEVAARTTALLSSDLERADAKSLAKDISGIASALVRAAKARSIRSPWLTAPVFRLAARALVTLADDLQQMGRVTDVERRRLSDILRTLVGV